MLDLISKIVYTSIGIASFSLEKAQELFSNLVEEEKITAEEGEKIVRELMRDAANIREEIGYQMQDVFKKLFSRAAQQPSGRIADLMARLEALEDLARRK